MDYLYGSSIGSLGGVTATCFHFEPSPIPRRKYFEEIVLTCKYCNNKYYERLEECKTCGARF